MRFYEPLEGGASAYPIVRIAEYKTMLHRHGKERLNASG
jgi:hypothetical protein